MACIKYFLFILLMAYIWFLLCLFSGIFASLKCDFACENFWVNLTKKCFVTLLPKGKKSRYAIFRVNISQITIHPNEQNFVGAHQLEDGIVIADVSHVQSCSQRSLTLLHISDAVVCGVLRSLACLAVFKLYQPIM